MSLINFLFPFASAALSDLLHPSEAQCFAVLMIILISSFTEERESLSAGNPPQYSLPFPQHPHLKAYLYLKNYFPFSFSFTYVKELFHLFLRDLPTSDNPSDYFSCAFNFSTILNLVYNILII